MGRKDNRKYVDDWPRQPLSYAKGKNLSKEAVGIAREKALQDSRRKVDAY